MANRVGYEKMEEEEMFVHLLTSGGKTNKHRINYNFLLTSLWEKKIMNNLPGIFFLLWWVCLARSGWKSEEKVK